MASGAAVLTHVGHVRSKNEDAFLIAEPSGLFVVCDGMGGHASGEVAAWLAVGELGRALVGRTRPHSAARKAELLEAAIQLAHERLLVESLRRDLPTFMGTTLVALWMGESHAVVASVGDSRAYRVGPREACCLTTDHTLAEQYREAGLISSEQVARHPLRGVLVRCVGSFEGCEADIRTVPIEPGERLLLCTDGLTGMVPEERVIEILREGTDPRSITQVLVDEALRRGGRDNVTALVVEGAGPEPPGGVLVGGV